MELFSLMVKLEVARHSLCMVMIFSMNQKWALYREPPGKFSITSEIKILKWNTQ